MLKFNGYFGCHFCTAEGLTIGKTHAYYPFHQSGQIRESNLNDVYVSIAEVYGDGNPVNVVGVKGESAFAKLIEGLPLCAPIDYMHCVLLGVFPELLKLCSKSLSTDEKIRANVVISGLSCPREMIAFSRKIRPLDELSQFKANEFFNWLFYIAPVLFLNRLSSELYLHLINLVYGMRLIFESSSVENVKKAEEFINKFCEEIVSFHGGNQRIETINVHCLKHLAEQVKRFGPLYCYSAMSFEAANRTLGDVFSGSHSECEIVCRRVLQRHKLVETEISEECLQPMFRRIGGVTTENSDNFDKDFLETEALKRGKSAHPHALFFNRQFVGNTYYDSLSYKRSNLGNSYVSFTVNGRERFGQIQYFMKLQNLSPPNNVLANLRIYSVSEAIGLVKGHIHRVTQTSDETFVDVNLMSKAFFFADFSKELPFALNSYYFIKLLSSFEHS